MFWVTTATRRMMEITQTLVDVNAVVENGRERRDTMCPA
jgi:hypothetical protein